LKIYFKLIVAENNAALLKFTANCIAKVLPAAKKWEGKAA
jgi:hypothetical protein